MSNVLKFPNRATLVRRYVEVGRELWSLDERLDSERIAEMQRHVQGMDDDALARYRSAEAIGHRPTWKMGPRGGAHGAPHVDETVYAEARSMRRKGARRTGDAAQAPRYNALALKALSSLELDGQATEVSIKAKYKELVKRHHPDANGGDRSSEDRLREIIQAYNFLRANKLV